MHFMEILWEFEHFNYHLIFQNVSSSTSSKKYPYAIIAHSFMNQF